MGQAPRWDDLVCFRPIGIIERPESDTVGPAVIEGLRAEPVRLVVRPELVDGLCGLTGGSDILVLTYFERASRATLLVHPRGDMGSPLRGVFATRSPSRPNPICVTSARVVAVDGNVLVVVGLDAWDGTAVLDIKHLSEAFDEPYVGAPERGA